MSKITMAEGAAPATPGTNKVVIYAKADGQLYSKDDVGTEFPLSLAGAGFINEDGTIPLIANWDAGAFEIRAQTFYPDQTTGTPPMTVDSTTKVANLNADLLDDQEAADLSIDAGFF